MDGIDSLFEHVFRFGTPEQLKLFEENLKLWVATVDMNKRPQHFDSFDTDSAMLVTQWSSLMEDIGQVQFYEPQWTSMEELEPELFESGETPVLPEPTNPNRKQVSPTTRFEILVRDGFRCQICGATAQDRVRLEIDHRIPSSKGGETCVENLWTLCRTCNRGKRDRLVQ
jgi:hypothetical protein